MMRNYFKMALFLSGWLSFIGVNRLNAQKLSLEWASQIAGKGGTAIVSSTAIDKDENVFAVGGFRDSIDVATVNGQVKLLSKGVQSMFVAKIRQDGALLWIKKVGGSTDIGINRTNMDMAYYNYFSVVIDEHDNLYIAGSYKETVDFDPGSGQALRTTGSYVSGSSFPGLPPPVVFYENSFLLKLDGNGEFVWVKTIEGHDNAAWGIAMDKEEGTVAITGTYKDSLILDAQTTGGILTYVGSGSVFVAKYDTAGNFAWAKQMSNTKTGKSANIGRDISIDPKGNIYTTGIFSDSSDFDPGPSIAYLEARSKNQNIFISKLDRKGDYVWAKSVGGLYTPSESYAITTDTAGNVFISGWYQGLATFDPDPANTNQTILASVGNLTYFLAKLNTDGDYEWAKQLDPLPGSGNINSDAGLGLQTDEEGNVYAAGHFGAKQVYFDNNSAESGREVFGAPKSNGNPFFIKYSPSGNYLWGRQVQGNDRGLGFAVSVAPSGAVYLSGSFSTTSNFDPSATTPYNLTAGKTDGFVMKLYCSDSSSKVLTVEQCSDSFVLNDEVYTQSGVYTQMFLNTSGCDSTVYLNLTLNKIIKPVINVNGFELGTATTYASYQWLLNGTAIPGATNQKYTVTQNGDYRVAVATAEGCLDTSDIYKVTNSGIVDIDALSKQISVYPNPTDGLVHIQAPVAVDVALTTITGRQIKVIKKAQQVSLDGLADGLYLLRITDEDGTLIKVEKVAKTQR